MRKMALILALLMVVSIGSAYCSVSTTLDGVIESKSKSDIRPVEDTAKLAGEINKGLNEITKPLDPVLKPVYEVRDHSIKASKTVLNTVWDALTLKSFRDKKEGDK
ncbi:MAG TPA: hypothetical protein VJA00_02905 [Candidatus Omnitrophota bacterium]|nr:hypothetical protein [Candidatus Omnitrophota bacterium]